MKPLVHVNNAGLIDAVEEVLARTSAHGFELHDRVDAETSEITFHAQVRCHCGSALSSGDWLPSVKRAVLEAKGNLEEHQKRWHA